MLLQICDFVRREGVVNTQQLTREFRLDLSALHPMLELLVRRGLIQRCQDQTSCQSTCFKCQNQLIEYYQWV